MSLVPVAAYAGRQVEPASRAAPVSRHRGPGGGQAAMPRTPTLSGQDVGSSLRGSQALGASSLRGSSAGPAASGHRGVAAARPDAAGVAGTQGMSIENLLAALQRGTVPGADNNVAFLCQKYTSLLERLRLAEQGELTIEERCVTLDADLRAEQAEEHAERSELAEAAATAREDAAKLEASLVEARSEESTAQQELCKTRAEAEDCQQRRVALDEQCVSERSRLAEVNSRFRQMQITRPVGHTELRRLQSQLQALTSQYHAAAEELTGHRERAAKEEASLTEFKAEALREEEARDHASELAARHREELSEALSELALLKERLAEAQVGVQRCEDELERRSERRQALQAEIQKYDAWLSNASRQMEDLHEVDRGLARVHGDTAEVRSSLSQEEAEVRSSEAAGELKEAAVAEAERQLLERTERLETVESERVALQAEVSHAEEEQAQLEAVIEQLHHDQAAGGGLRRNLEHETQLLLAEAERLRHERDGRLADRSEMLQRLRLLTPALTEARRRVRELEENLESVRSEASRERQLAERLEREAGACQDKMRVLRDQNVRLAEQCTELEAQLASASARRPELLRARSASACGIRSRNGVSVERQRRASGGRGHDVAGSSSARGRTTTPLDQRPQSAGPGLHRRRPMNLDADLEDPAMHDVVLTGERSSQEWAAAPPMPIQHQADPLAAKGSDLELDMRLLAPGVAVPGEFDVESAGAARSAGTTPREGVPRNQNLQFLRDWIQNEEERLSSANRVATQS